MSISSLLHGLISLIISLLLLFSIMKVIEHMRPDDSSLYQE
jgi:hypothetical protein